MKIRWAACAAALLALSGCASTRLKVGRTPEGEVIDAVGETPNDATDVDGTKRRARFDAQKNAVERVVGVQVSARTQVDKALLIDSKILTRSDGYVKKYDVLKEWIEPPLYRIRIRALVSYQQIADDLRDAGILEQPHVGNPRVAVLLNENVKGGDEAGSFGGDALMTRGFRVVERADLMAAKATEVQKEVDHGDTSHMASLGKTLDAEILVFGSVDGAPLENTGLEGMISIRATLSAKAYKAESNEVLASSAKAASGLDAARGPAVMKAFGNAGKAAGEEMAQAILDALKKKAFVSVTVSGLDGIEQLKRVEDAVSHVPGVQDIYLRSFRGSNAQLEVRIRDVTTQEIARALERVQDLKAKVEGVTGESLNVTLQPAGQ